MTLNADEIGNPPHLSGDSHAYTACHYPLCNTDTKNPLFCQQHKTTDYAALYAYARQNINEAPRLIMNTHSKAIHVPTCMHAETLRESVERGTLGSASNTIKRRGFKTWTICKWCLGLAQDHAQTTKAWHSRS